MKTVTALALLAALFAAGCTQPLRPIPPGTYRPAAGEERIVVTASRIWFHVNVDRDNPDVIGSREYPYDVLEDGRIHFVVSSNSAFGLSLAMDYLWFWRGDRISKVDLETGEKTWFVMQE